MSTPITRGPVTKHGQLRARLTELAARLPAGAALPGERQIGEQHGVSRITVREAVGQLVNDGVLVRVPGSGTYVAERPARSRMHLASFTDDMRRLGLEPSTVVLDIRRERPPRDTCDALSLGCRDTAWHVRRLRLADSTPMSVDDAWYAADLAPYLCARDLTKSIYDVLADQFGAAPDRAEQTVRAGEVDEDTGALLGLGAGRAVLVFERVSWTGGRAIEHARSVYRGDRYEVVTTVVSGSAHPSTSRAGR